MVEGTNIMLEEGSILVSEAAETTRYIKIGCISICEGGEVVVSLQEYTGYPTAAHNSINHTQKEPVLPWEVKHTTLLDKIESGELWQEGGDLPDKDEVDMSRPE